MKAAGLLFIIACALLACDAQQGVPAWLLNEMRLIKVDAETNVKSAQYVLDRIQETLRRSLHYTSSYQRETRVTVKPKVKPTKPPQSRAPASTYPRDCTDAMSRDRRGGWKMIDPDGENYGAKPFYVRCEAIGNTITTEFGLYSEWMQRYEGGQSCMDGRDLRISGSNIYCAKTETLVPYKPTPQQLRAALLVSGNCSQTVSWNCHGNSILYLNPGSNRMFVYGQKLQNSNYFAQGTCKCAENRSCRQPDLKCHCGSDMNDIWLRDTITITDKSHLPVTELVLGDMAGDRDRAQVSVSAIKCYS